ncbi:hypothetical protein AUC70_05860 [Methyloceanibacter stevinii]|uniref:Uncharacterized protein n=1 Tax=Methyloceanibacter stevinii TaxID=1774970 RepID=A0A1E3VP04_9HYPH|nr:hypothetical protein AUC70_05860 [Methyloceanibacter stevinii]
MLGARPLMDGWFPINPLRLQGPPIDPNVVPRPFERLIADLFPALPYPFNCLRPGQSRPLTVTGRIRQAQDALAAIHIAVMYRDMGMGIVAVFSAKVDGCIPWYAGIPSEVFHEVPDQPAPFVLAEFARQSQTNFVNDAGVFARRPLGAIKPVARRLRLCRHFIDEDDGLCLGPADIEYVGARGPRSMRAAADTPEVAAIDRHRGPLTRHNNHHRQLRSTKIGSPSPQFAVGRTSRPNAQRRVRDVFALAARRNGTPERQGRALRSGHRSPSRL